MPPIELRTVYDLARDAAPLLRRRLSPDEVLDVVSVVLHDIADIARGAGGNGEAVGLLIDRLIVPALNMAEGGITPEEILDLAADMGEIASALRERQILGDLGLTVAPEVSGANLLAAMLSGDQERVEAIYAALRAATPSAEAKVTVEIEDEDGDGPVPAPSMHKRIPSHVGKGSPPVPKIAVALSKPRVQPGAVVRPGIGGIKRPPNQGRPPVAEPPVELPPEEQEPPTASIPLKGVTRFLLRTHTDGLAKRGADELTWIGEASDLFARFLNRGIVLTWEITIEEIEAIEGAKAGWLATVSRSENIRLAFRESHGAEKLTLDQRRANTEAGHTRALALGINLASHLGSCLDEEAYNEGQSAWRYTSIGGISTPNHVEDPNAPKEKWDGIRQLASGQFLFGSGSAASIAWGQGTSRDVAHGILDYAIKEMTFNGLDPATGGRPYFATPRVIGTATRTAKEPVPIETALDQLLGWIAQNVPDARILWTDHAESLATWIAAGQPPANVLDMTDKDGD